MALNGQIAFEHLGIGRVLETKRLRVPLNQREYSWRDEHVNDLYTDLLNALASKGNYFLGTIVLTSGITSDVPEVSDGQQRLSTTMIMLAAVRDWFLRNGDESRAKSIEDSFLFQTDLKTTELVPRLSLNVDDDEFFRKRILSRPGTADRKLEQSRGSHELLVAAYNQAHQTISTFLQAYAEQHRVTRLIEWVEYIKHQALVIVLSVPDHIDAFVMFETLNDRGLKASQADLIKNHLLSLAKDRIREVQQYWARMLGILETIEGDLTVTYLHHYLITTQGPTKEREVFDRVKRLTTSSTAAVNFLENIATSATDYVALFNPEHDKWNEYESVVRRSLSTINRDLRVQQIRPLLFAVAQRFSPKETAKAFRIFVSWSVRFLVVGGRGGLLDRNYAGLAARVGTGQIKTTQELIEAAANFIPNDAEFETSFASATVSQSHLARYYLRALEKQIKKEPEPEWVPTDDERAVNLEHVLPENPEQFWATVSADDAEAYYKRIGNLAILQASKNSRIGNKSFSEKQTIFAKSTYYWTQAIGKQDDWGLKEIEVRQRNLARIAPQTWPIRIG